MRAIITFIFILLLVQPVFAWDCENAVGSAAHKCFIKFFDSADHVTPKTGLTGASVTCSKSENGGSATACAGSVANALDDAAKPGIYVFSPAAGDVDTAGTVEMTFTIAGADQADVTMLVGGMPVQDGSISYNSFASRGTLQSCSTKTCISGEYILTTNILRNTACLLVTSGTYAGWSSLIRGNSNANPSVFTLDKVPPADLNGSNYDISFSCGNGIIPALTGTR